MKTKELLEYIQQTEKDAQNILAKSDFLVANLELENLIQKARSDFDKKDMWEDNNSSRWKHCDPSLEKLEQLLQQSYAQLPGFAIKNSGRFDEVWNRLESKRLYALLGQMGDKKTFDYLVNKAEDDFLKEYYDFSTSVVEGLVELYKNNSFKKDIVEIFKKSFDAMFLFAVKNGKLVNSVGFNIYASACAALGEKELIDSLLKAYSYATHPYAHYELNKTTAAIALSLSALDYDGNLKLFKEFLDEYEWRYEGDDFVMDNLYSSWLIRQDQTSPVEYLLDTEKKKGFAKVACALADLNVQSALPHLKSKQLEISDPVAQEVFKEAIDRLSNQSCAPAANDRMIWMYGKKTSTEIVLGSETENIFVLRARALQGKDDIGTMTETDESNVDET